LISSSIRAAPMRCGASRRPAACRA
jgi:hypothetical protein